MTALPLQQRVLRRVANAPRIRVANAPRLVVVPPPARHPLLLTVASLLVFAAAVFGAVTFNALAADEAVLARQLDGRLGTAESQYSQLLAEVAGLESPARIADEATELGLVRVDHPRQLHVRRLLAADGAADTTPRPGDRTDRLKPLLADG